MTLRARDKVSIKFTNLAFTLPKATNPKIISKKRSGGDAVGGAAVIEGEEETLLQSYTTVSEHQKKGRTSTKKQLKVKRSDSNGSQ